MRLDSNRDVDIDDRPRHGKGRAEETAYSLPHRRRDQVQRAERRTSRREEERSLEEDRTNMPPAYLERSSTDAYRRPRPALVYDYEQDSPRRRSRRDASPVYSPRYSREQYYSSQSSASEAARGRRPRQEEEVEDDHIEVVVEESPKRTDRRRSRDEYMGYPPSLSYPRPRRRHRSDDDLGSRRPRSISPAHSPVREARRIDTSESPRKSRHINTSTDVLDSRPPVSKKSVAPFVVMLMMLTMTDPRGACKGRRQ